MSQSQSQSVRSNKSSTMSRLFNEEDLSDADLIKQVAALKQEVRILQIENEIVENTINRLDPTLLHGLQAAYEYALKLSAGSIGAASSGGRGSFIRSKTSTFGLADSLTSPSKMLTCPSRLSTRRIDSSARLGGTTILGHGPPTKINVMERSEMVATEIEALYKFLAKARRKAASQHALLRAQLEEISLREVDFERATVDFHKDVEVEGWDKIAQRIPAEIWIRYMTEWVKICDSQIGKLRLRTSTLNTQFYKFKGQIRAKAELSESLRPVDFEKLEIENEICHGVIEEKRVHLVDLKKMTGDANLNLTVHKKALISQGKYLQFVKDGIKSRQRQMIDLQKETEVIRTQADYYQNKLDEVKQVRNAYEVPDVMDYVMVKAEVADLKYSIKILQNRTHIHEIALTSLNKKLKSMRLSK